MKFSGTGEGNCWYGKSSSAATGEEKVHCNAIRCTHFKCWPKDAQIIQLSMEGRCGRMWEGNGEAELLTKKKEIHLCFRLNNAYKFTYHNSSAVTTQRILQNGEFSLD